MLAICRLSSTRYKTTFSFVEFVACQPTTNIQHPPCVAQSISIIIKVKDLSFSVSITVSSPPQKNSPLFCAPSSNNCDECKHSQQECWAMEKNEHNCVYTSNSNRIIMSSIRTSNQPELEVIQTFTLFFFASFFDTIDLLRGELQACVRSKSPPYTSLQAHDVVVVVPRLYCTIFFEEVLSRERRKLTAAQRRWRRNW